MLIHNINALYFILSNCVMQVLRACKAEPWATATLEKCGTSSRFERPLPPKHPKPSMCWSARPTSVCSEKPRFELATVLHAHMQSQYHLVLDSLTAKLLPMCAFAMQRVDKKSRRRSARDSSANNVGGCARPFRI